MKEIKLTKGQIALVDDEDYDYLNQWKWFVIGVERFYYAGRRAPNKNKIIKMHRLILNAPANKFVDHNGLNNQKCNLRLCTNSENQMNCRIRDNRKYKGVRHASFINGGKRYEYIKAGIQINGKHIRLGYFKTEEAAARAYDSKAKEIFGQFANLNFKTA